MRREDFSVFESTTVVSSVSLEFLCSEGLQAGQEWAAVEGELFSRFWRMTSWVGANLISFGSQLQAWLGNRPSEWIILLLTRVFILTKQPPKNLTNPGPNHQQGKILHYSAVNIQQLPYCSLSFFPPPMLTEHKQMLQTSVSFASVSSFTYFLNDFFSIFLFFEIGTLMVFPMKWRAVDHAEPYGHF